MQGSSDTALLQPDLIILKEMAEAGKLTAVIDRTYALSQVPDAFRYLGTHGVSGKLVIRIH